MPDIIDGFKKWQSSREEIAYKKYSPHDLREWLMVCVLANAEMYPDTIGDAEFLLRRL